MSNYIPTIGIEVHAELKTKTKVFSHSINDYNVPSNINVNEIDLGYPGTLPRVNVEVVKKALKASLAFNCSVNQKMHFDRKNYFYPDLPKGYQITQNRTPIGHDGYVEINTDSGIKRIDIERVHIEEDTCKSIHENGKTFLNYNRAGVPLIEIVTKPVMHSSEEAVKYIEALKEILLYLEISDCKIEEGSMRADVNISISKDNVLGTKCEIKNIGSISNVKIAIEEEIKRQSKILDSGLSIEEETRRFNSKTNTTEVMRKKEVGNDYRYFPEPDIPYISLSDDFITNIKKDIVFLPNERRKVYYEKGILEINADKLINNKDLSDFLNKFINEEIDFKMASNLLLGDISFYLNKSNKTINDTKIEFKFKDLVNKLEKGDISSKIFKDILTDVMESDLSIDDILKEKGISLNSNKDELMRIINTVLDNNQDSVNDYKKGKENALKYLMGLIMKETKGSANPKIVNDLLRDLLSKDVN